MSLEDDRHEFERMIWAAAFGARYAFDRDADAARTLADDAVHTYPKTSVYVYATPPPDRKKP